MRDYKNAMNENVIEFGDWDCKIPIYSAVYDIYFANREELMDFLDVCEPAKLELFLCEPVFLKPINDDYFADEMPTDCELPDDVYAALNDFNEAIRSAAPIGWQPSSTRVNTDFLTHDRA